jgi:thiamine pyrophosphate-dependent acetolactate synthase large subunit-like protein
MQQSDLLIALGSRFDDRVTGKLDGFAPDAKIIHVDIDPAELGKVRRPDVPIVGDCRLVIEELIGHPPLVNGGRPRGLEAAPGGGALPAHLQQSTRPAEAAVLETLRDNTPRTDRASGGPAPDVASQLAFRHPLR